MDRRVLSEEGLGAILPSLAIFGEVRRQWNSKRERARSALERSRRATPFPKRQDRQRVGNRNVGATRSLDGHQPATRRFGSVMRSRPRS
jgi:hypothetical protein